MNQLLALGLVVDKMTSHLQAVLALCDDHCKRSSKTRRLLPNDRKLQLLCQ